MDTEVKRIKIRNKAAYVKAREHFLEVADKVTVPKILRTTYDKEGNITSAQRDLIIGNVGRTMNFGFIRTRSGYKDAVSNARQPELFKACVEIGNLVVPKGWKYSTITLNHNVKAKKHIDGTNVGDSVIVAIGDFEGGGLYTYNPDGTKPKLMDIEDQPAMFNGAILPHKTQPFKGNRYTLIFYNMKEGGKVKGITMVGKGDEEEEDDLVGGVFA